MKQQGPAAGRPLHTPHPSQGKGGRRGLMDRHSGACGPFRSGQRAGTSPAAPYQACPAGGSGPQPFFLEASRMRAA